MYLAIEKWFNMTPRENTGEVIVLATLDKVIQLSKRIKP